MHDWLKRAHTIPMDGGVEWWKYLAIDASGDLWLYSDTYEGMVRFSYVNPAHWLVYARSWSDRMVVWADYA